ncbi:nitrate/nitrite transporter [Streptomyces beihaiensis]|uniref:NarK/NasA family nitrate transporter n=1 Tax=Streptomyces beihaiensis TaxID=2984495 RepID=A0ABT3U4S8_9ACTN|nr:nitrate/nitrite transporter [Streptomyces beihaiensis]MCX3064289.1 NarK/NasA family nitrate transporter [Streptomyces beihaiensis]
MADRSRTWIEQWDPEDETFWETEGRRVARRNLTFSVLSEHIGFSVWSMFSVLALSMGPAYGIDPAGKFFLVAVASLVGAVLRVPYGFAVARFGGRNWTLFSASLLLVPTLALLIFMRPGTSYSTFMVIAVFTGVGGANFASSMTNINSFYPQRLKGWALGMNAGGGNIGVAVVHLMALLVIGVAGAGHPRVLLAIYVPLIVVSVLLSARNMNNLGPVRNDTGAAKEAVKEAHTWIMSFLYIGTFGSFIGYSFAFGLVLQNQFGRTPLQAASITFIGPLLGSVIRPIGGQLADRLGGAKVTLWNFALMAVAGLVVVIASTRESLPLFITGFIALFVLTGIGNGSTYKMIPGIFGAQAAARGMTGQEALTYTRRLSGASMALIGAVGALGGLGINLALRQSFLSVGSGTGAFAAFLGYYVVCFAVTWAVYLRGGATDAVAAPTAQAEPRRDLAEVGGRGA